MESGRAVGYKEEIPHGNGDGDLFPSLLRRDDRTNNSRDRDYKGRGRRNRGDRRDRDRDSDRDMDRSMSPERMDTSSGKSGGRWNRDNRTRRGGDSYSHPGRLREDSRTTSGPRGRDTGDDDTTGGDGSKWVKGDKLEGLQLKGRLESGDDYGSDDLRSRFDPRPSTGGERRRNNNRRRAQDHF